MKTEKSAHSTKVHKNRCEKCTPGRFGNKPVHNTLNGSISALFLWQFTWGGGHWLTLSFPSAQSTATMGYWNQSLQSPLRPHQQSRSRQGRKLPDTGTAPELPPLRPPPRPGHTLLRAFILLYTKSGNVFRGMNRPAPGVTNMFPSSSTTLP